MESCVIVTPRDIGDFVQYWQRVRELEDANLVFSRYKHNVSNVQFKLISPTFFWLWHWCIDFVMHNRGKVKLINSKLYPIYSVLVSHRPCIHYDWNEHTGSALGFQIIEIQVIIIICTWLICAWMLYIL